MKTAPRGPFERIAWFCEDGEIRPARAGCDQNGGGIQHGLLGERAIRMRDNGYMVANIIATAEPERYVGSRADLAALRQILMERFLIEADDGWILRVAKTSYRGALQAEDEEAGGERMIAAMLDDPRWRTQERFFLLRESFRLLPLDPGGDGVVTASDVRRQAFRLGNRDPGFLELRVKIHGMPGPGDAEAVRKYARARGGRLSGDYQQLASDIDRLYRSRNTARDVRNLAQYIDRPDVKTALTARADQVTATSDLFVRYAVTGQLLALLRRYAPEFRGHEAGRALMVTSLTLEAEMYAAGNELVDYHLRNATRRQRLTWLRGSIDGLYGTGLISERHALGLRKSVLALSEEDPTLDDYREQLKYLALAPQWADQTVQFHFSDAIKKFSPIEPKTRLYGQDRLRGSPFLVYGAVVDSMLQDAGHLSGVQHVLFGQPVTMGLRALNPGMARGVIRVPTNVKDTSNFDRDGIYLLPETVADLSPVAGILTKGEGSLLSHIQLLARNLGIPNVVISEDLVPVVKEHEGRHVILAVSPGGSIRLVDDDAHADDQPRSEPPSGLVIQPDLERLDLKTTGFISLDRLRARDSGRIVGPKAANNGELRHEFGETVPPGIVIPFGTFRRILDRPIEPGGPSAFEWMRERYDALARLSGNEQKRETNEFLARIRGWIERQEPGADFRMALRQALAENFGPDGTYGVFVRSDTNIEDLPGFTGAGLNRTVPNVVGERAIVDAIRTVWASPFTERSFSWRQGHMRDPEYVFPSVLIQRAFPSEKSGVMVTKDVAGGRQGWITIAVNEGVGGVVDGQAAESLRVNSRSGEVVYVSQATAPTKRELDPRGGVRTVPASGREAVLTRAEINQLIKTASEVDRAMDLEDEDGNPAAADIEFAFRGGRLALLQVRPLVESKSASRNSSLAAIDQRATARPGRYKVPLDQVPGAVGGREVAAR